MTSAVEENFKIIEINSYDCFAILKKNKHSHLIDVRTKPEWEFVGIEIQWDELEAHYRKMGLAPGLPSNAWRTSTPLYKGNKQVGYATSGCWSPILKRYIALAHVKAEYAKENTQLDFELKVEHFRKLTPARIVETPFFDPERKRSCPQ